MRSQLSPRTALRRPHQHGQKKNGQQAPYPPPSLPTIILIYIKLKNEKSEFWETVAEK